MAADLIQEYVAKHLGAAGTLSAPVEIIARVPQDPLNDIEASAANRGLCIFVWPTDERESLDNESAMIFFTRSEVRIGIIEVPALNATGVTAYELKYDVMKALQGNVLGGLLQYPLLLGNPPQVVMEGPATTDGALKGKKLRIIDVIFNAAYGLNPAG